MCRLQFALFRGLVMALPLCLVACDDDSNSKKTADNQAFGATPDGDDEGDIEEIPIGINDDSGLEFDLRKDNPSDDPEDNPDGESDSDNVSGENDDDDLVGGGGSGEGDDAPVPEPATLILLGAGTAAVAVARRRTQK